METLLLIIIIMSLTINILQFRAYISRELEVREILEMRDKLEKLRISLSKSLEENGKKYQRRGFFQGLFYQKKKGK